jgi:uncharacterized OB-fold protein
MKRNEIIEGVAGPKNCWPGHRKVGTQSGTGKNKGKRVNDCEKIKEGEAVIKTIDDKHAELNDPTTGVTYNIDRTNPQGAATLQPDAETGAVKFDPTPEPAGAVAAGDKPNPLAAGAKVEIDTMEAGEDGMKALAQAGRKGASETELDTIRDKHDRYDEARRKDDELLDKMLTIAKLR